LVALAPSGQSSHRNGKLSARGADGDQDARPSRPRVTRPSHLVRSRSLSQHVASFPLPDGVDLDEDVD